MTTTASVVDQVAGWFHDSERAEDIAERQDGLLSLGQARRAGISPRQVWRRRATGRYRRSRRGVVQIAGVPPTWQQALRAVSIAAGEAAVVSHGSAARLYGIELARAVHPRWRRDAAFLEVSAPIARPRRWRSRASSPSSSESRNASSASRL